MLGARGRPLGLSPQNIFESLWVRNVVVEGGFRRYALALACRVDLPFVPAEGAIVQPQARLAIAANQALRVDPLYVGDCADAICVQLLLELRADAADDADGLVGEIGRSFVNAECKEPTRLVGFRCRLGEDLVAGQSRRDGEPQILFNRFLKSHQADRRRGAVQGVGARQVEIGLVD